MDTDVYQHFRKDESPFIDRMNELLGTAENEYRPVLTEFLDPRKIYIASTLINKDVLNMYEFGGYSDAEKRRVIFAPSYYQLQQSDFQIQRININYPEKFAILKHNQVLGTLMNQSIDTDMFGDIITDGTHWQFFVDEKMADYLLMQVTQIGKINIHLEKGDSDSVITPTNDWEKENLTTASWRLDVMVSDVFNISRQRAKTLIDAGQVRVNWQEIQKPDYELKVLDMLSVRHFGRIQLLAEQGITRKNKLRLEIRTIRSK